MEIEPEQPKLSPDEEEQPYSIENLPICVSTNYSSVTLPSTILQITSDGITFLIQQPQDQWFSIYASFSNTNSVGVVGNSLMIFIGDQEVQEQQQMPQILKLIRDTPPGGNVQLQNQVFTLSIDFKKEGQNVLKEVNDILVNYMGEADQHLSRYDEDQDFDKMISADDIDQNGNIIDKEPHDCISGVQQSSQEEEEAQNPPDLHNH